MGFGMEDGRWVEMGGEVGVRATRKGLVGSYVRRFWGGKPGSASVARGQKVTPNLGSFGRILGESRESFSIPFDTRDITRLLISFIHLGGRGCLHCFEMHVHGIS